MVNIMCRVVLILIITAGIFFAPVAHALNVVLLIPAEKQNPFWSLVAKNSEVAAKQFDINLSTYYIDDLIDRFTHYDIAKKIITKSPTEIDYFITSLHVNKTQELLTLMDDAKIKFISIVNDPLASATQQVGNPREFYPYWLGQVSPDDVLAGQYLTEILIEKALENDLDATGISAITGARDNTAVSYRSNGIKTALKQYPNFSLNRITYSDWSYEKVINQANFLVKRYTDTSVFWCANDSLIASNVINTMIKYNLRPNKDIMIGGMDWSVKGISLYEQGLLTTSLGGHIFDGAIALALIYDLEHGYDFYQQYGGKVMQKLTRLDLHFSTVASLINNNSWSKLNFRTYSRALNPNKTRWNLTYGKVLNTYPKQP
jgi:ABC-type sugar transport system substrate-binding protein